MFEIGFSELALIAFVALIVLGPERLPSAARTVGSLLRRARSSWTSLRDEIERELAIKESVDSIKRAAEPMRESIDQLRHDVETSAQEARDAIAADTAADPAPRIETPEPPREPRHE